ncbi:MAG TPA: nickel pincer cofactor biosynthesis protein LarC [Mycobacteriales bacterium]|nr:nickel pincer cofactor biosynthesis protein LarC [Mycobacteriales bacterium]
MTRIGWWNCASGVSGDMLLGALVDAGVALPVLQQAIDALAVGPVRLSAESVTRGALAATRVQVAAPESQEPRTLATIRRILVDAGGLHQPVREIALDIFGRLARAEAAAHGSSLEDVHFHEIGALDALADIVGAAAGICELGLDGFGATPVATGSGTVATSHGLLPVPTPAVLALFAAVGAPVLLGGPDVELATPTGAAILAATVQRWGSAPAMVVRAHGLGAGSREVHGQANVLGLVVGELAADGTAGGSLTEMLVVEANVDDVDPRLWPGVLDRLLAAGAADAWLTPIVMKKGRPAHTVHALVTPADAAAVRHVLFTETTTIGLREYPVTKRALDRAEVSVDVDGRPVRVKLAYLDGRIVGATPEFDDVAAAASALGRPVRGVLAAAIAAAEQVGRPIRATGLSPD